MKQLIASTLLLTATVAQAGEVITADTNLQIGANTILANFERITEVPASETPNVDKSLAIGANSILGIFPVVTKVSDQNVPSVDASSNAFIDGVMNRGGYASDNRSPSQYVDNGVAKPRG